MINFGNLGDIIDGIGLMKYFAFAIQLFHIPFIKWLFFFMGFDLSMGLIGKMFDSFAAESSYAGARGAHSMDELEDWVAYVGRGDDD